MNISQNKQEQVFAYKILAPMLLILLGLIIYPLIYNIYLSFFDVSLSGKKIFIGFQNFQALFSDREMYASLRLTFVFLFFTVLGSTLIGLVVAIVLNQNFLGKNFVQTIILLPYFAPIISVVFGWQFIFDPVNGIYNHLIVDVFHFSTERKNLINDPEMSMIVLVLFNIWKYYPISYLMILSRLKAIDKTLYEAAHIDGASWLERFKMITYPEVKFTLATVVILRFVWNLNRFEDVYLLSPNINILSVYTYKKAFLGLPEQGTAASIAIVQLILVGIFIWFYVKKILKW